MLGIAVTPSRRLRYLTECLFLLVLLLIFAGYIAYTQYDDYLRTESEQSERLQSKAAVIERNLVPQLFAARRVIDGILGSLPAWKRQSDGMRLADRQLQTIVGAQATIRGLLIIDAGGRVLSSNKAELIGRNVFERDYFQTALNSASPEKLHVTPPFKTVLDTFVISLYRIIPGPKGEFDGIVIASLDPESFHTLLDSVRYSPDATSSIVHGDGKLFMMVPQRDDLAGKDLAKPGTFFSRHRDSTQPTSTFSGLAYVNGQERMITFRSVQPAGLGMDKPLVVTVSRDLQSLFAAWDRAFRIEVGMFGIVALIALLSLFLHQRRQRAFDAAAERQARGLQASEARLHSFFDATPDTLLIVDEQGVITLANQQVEALLGYRVEELLGSSVEVLVPEGFRSEHPALRNAFAESPKARRMGFGMEVTARRKDGSECGVEVGIGRIETADGMLFACSLRDIGERLRSDAALRESEARYRSIFDGAGTGIASTDANGQVVSFNEAFRAMLGYDADALMKMNFADLTHPDDLAVEIELFKEVLAGLREQYRIEKRYLARDGRVVWVDISVAVMRDTQGQAENFVAVVNDITLRKQHEEQTRQLLVENETILQNALVGIAFLKHRRIVSCNRRFEEIFHYETGELIGESSERLYESTETFEEIGRAAYRAVANNKNYSTEVRLRHKDGSLFWGALSGRAFDPAQPQEGSVWIYADISERRQAEQESGKLLQAVEQSPVSIVITDRACLVEYVNPSFTRITGYTLDEVIGQTPRFLRSEDTSLATSQELWRTISAGRIWRGVLHNRCKNGNFIWEEMSISPIVDKAGEITHFVAVKEDVTERKRIEQQLEQHQAHLEDLVLQRTAELSAALAASRLADLAKDEFLANITHELRTPLSAVIGFAGLARPFCTDARQSAYLDKVNSAGKMLSGIIDDLLDLSKIVAGRLEFESAPFSLRQIVLRSRSVISFKAQEKGLELIEQIADEVPDVLLGDSLRVEQIMLNLLSNAVKFTAAGRDLLSNAVKFTAAGRVELRIALHARADQRVCLSFEVEDTGIGLRQEEIALLFKPFSQADASMTRKFGGTGLGLTICKRLAELMGGTIGVTSVPGKGSTFRATLWLHLAEAADLPLDDDEPGSSAPVHYDDARVLVVDDQPFNRDIVEGLLAAVGISPCLAENGREAIDILSSSRQPFDLVLMDVQMPIMDGLTATRVIRKLEGLAHLPVIAMTAHTMAHERDKSLDAGMDDHIGKPFDETTFYRVLAKWIPLDKQRRPGPSAVRPTPASGLPPLSGVDTRAGLSLLLGDEARYRHWLGEFVAEAPGAMQQIRRALGAGQSESASMTTHTLKGRMGLLGMNGLYVLAAALEAAIDAADASDKLLFDLEQGVGAMCAEIAGALGLRGKSEVAVESLPGLPADLPAGLPPDCVTRLVARLWAGDSDCDMAVAECLAELAESAWAPYLRQALHYVNNFDFAAAGRLLSGGRGEVAVEGS